MSVVLMDTSVAVPLLLAGHSDHARVAAWAKGRSLAFAGHAVFETYAVLTRLPAASRLTPDQAGRLIGQYAQNEYHLGLPDREVIDLLARQGFTGGQIYDALVALAAAGNRLASRDRRALELYDKLDVVVETVF
ncbi:MAG: VapC toxin family PIN domain ribonuclease [Propionibacteriaceae bacterium]|jgi:predicted nucleic acid-binding protein|nr:VapC toxin family PIN domain ribonuclease [Propionibacteriaceae bacterium]